MKGDCYCQRGRTKPNTYQVVDLIVSVSMEIRSSGVDKTRYVVGQRARRSIGRHL